MIKEVDGKFCVMAHESGKNMGCYDTKEEAEKRLEQIGQFKEYSKDDPFIPIEFIAVACSDCAKEMKKRGWTSIRLSKIPTIKLALADLCDGYGGEEGFFGRCVDKASSFADDPEAFCGALHLECFGETPAEKHAGEMSKIQFAKKPIKMPILPAKPSKTVDGREVTQELIDAVLSYDSKIRPAIVKLDREEAHSKHDGKQNVAVVGKVDKTYEKDGVIMADVFPAKGWEEALPILSAEDGSFPDRSIEADHLNLKGDSKQLWLEAVALCGTQRPALNLPAVTFTTTRDSNQKITYHISLTGGEQMPNENKSDDKVTLTKTELDAEFAKRESSLREEIRKESGKEAAELKERLDFKDLESWVNSSGMLRKLRTDQRGNAVQILLGLKHNKEKITYAAEKESKEVNLYEAVKVFLEGLSNVLPETKELAGHLPSQLTKGEEVPIDLGERSKAALAKINAYAKEKNIDAMSVDGFEKAEKEVRALNPELFEGVK